MNTDDFISDEIFLAGASGMVYSTLEDSGLFDACKSPIERRFAGAFVLYCGLLEGCPLPPKLASVVPRPRIILDPQHVVEPYRVDFLISYSGTSLRRCGIVVECDGHDFHEKTREQAARDKARDRFLNSRFAKVLRFTGSEIYNSPFECAAEAFGALDGAYSDSSGSP